MKTTFGDVAACALHGLARSRACDGHHHADESEQPFAAASVRPDDVLERIGAGSRRPPRSTRHMSAT